MTKLTYLNDTYLFEATATINELIDTENSLAVITNQTIFYPQGGGQPCDQGEISSNNTAFYVSNVRMNDKGEVLHYGEYKQGKFQIGDQVKLSIDHNRRLLNTKLHSAGHLVDCAVEALNLTNLSPGKGYHFPAGPYVEYNGMLNKPLDFIPAVEDMLNQLIKRDLRTIISDLSPSEAKQRNIWAPPGKAARIVNFEGFQSCGCGGTHVVSAAEIGSITIRKISSKKGVTRIAYSVG